MDNDPDTYAIIGAAIEVSKHMKIGLLESVYQKCLAREFNLRDIPYRQQPLLPVLYKDLEIDQGFRPDFIVMDAVVIEAKAVSQTAPAHEAQILNYMRLSKLKKGLLINFHAFPFAEGIKRFSL